MSQAIAAMPKYERYKDSGERWIGKIPTHWEVEKLKYLFSEKKHRQNMALSSGSISFGEVVEKDDEKILESTKRSYQEVLEGEFLLNPLNLNYDLKSLRIALSKINVVVSAGYIVLKEKIDINKQYFKYLLHRFDIAHMKLMGAGVRQTINYGHIANSLLLLPSSKEQEAIAKFLDEKTVQIDEAIKIKEQQVVLLKERKQIIIQNAVTKGLNPTAPMKDSGVDWIGDIPAHWKVEPGMNVLREKKDSNKGMKESRVLSLSYGKIIIKPEEKLVGLVPESFETYQIAVPGDIIIRCTDLQNDQTSLRTGLVENKGIITSAYLNLNVKGPHFSEFVHYFLHFLDITKVLYKFGSGLRQNLSWVDFKRMPMVIVPYDEQREIVKYIEDKSAEIKSATDLLIQQIDKLKEYKASLINSAVTGKIKVI